MGGLTATANAEPKARTDAAPQARTATPPARVWRAKPAPAKARIAAKSCKDECKRLSTLEQEAKSAEDSRLTLSSEFAALRERFDKLSGPAPQALSPEDSARLTALQTELGSAEGNIKRLKEAVDGGLDESLVAPSLAKFSKRVTDINGEIATLTPKTGALPDRLDELSRAVDEMQKKFETGPRFTVSTAEKAGDVADAASAAPAGRPQLEATASFFSRYEVREDYAALGKTAGRFSESDLVRYRARLGLRTTPIDIGPGKKVIVTFTPQASGVWADKGGTLADGELAVHSATLRLKGESYWIDSGRFGMAYGEHLVIGTVGWHETARTFDGIRAHFDVGSEGAYIDGFVTQVAEDPDLVKPLAAGDQYFGGVYAGLGPQIAKGLDLDGYALGQVWPKTGGMTPKDTGVQLTLGSRVKKKLGIIDLRAETGVQFGMGSVEQLGYQVDAEVGANLAAGKVRVAAGAWYASGDDPDTAKNEGWSQLYPTAHKFLGFADIVGGRSNITGGIARLKVKATPQLIFGSDGHLFFRPETSSEVDAYTGVELDTWGLHKIGKGLGLRGGYSVFVPSKNGPFASKNVAHYLEVQLKYDLK